MTQEFTKSVDIVAKNDEDRTATGVVLTPFELDRQLDWLRPDGIQNLYAETPDDGVMHASFPEGDAELERNEVLSESETIDGEEFDAGEWVIRRQYQDDTRWGLVKSGLLSSFSIGGEITDGVEYDSVEDIPDEVAIPGEVDPETVPDRHQPPTQIVDGTIDEISDVDIGAVPSADMAVVKSIGKNILEDAPTEESFLRVMEERNPDASESEIRALWDYLTSVGKSAESKSDERAESRGGAITNDDMTDDAGTESDDGSANQSVENVDDATLGARIKRVLFGTEETDDATGAEDKTQQNEKAGRTLNAANIREVKAARDHTTRLLAAAGVEEPTGMYRTYDEDEKDNFSLSSFSKNADADVDTESESTMSTDELADTVETLADKVDMLTEKLDESDDEGDDEEAEKTDEQDDEQLGEVVDKIDAIAEQVDGLEDRVDKVAKSSADTDQATGGGSESEDDSGLDDLAKLLG